MAYPWLKFSLSAYSAPSAVKTSSGKIPKLLATDKNQIHTDRGQELEINLKLPEFICVHLIFICGKMHFLRVYLRDLRAFAVKFPP